jgi:bacterioferritin-associated ferredoxin
VIICQCAAVSDRAVSEAVASGARSLAQVCRATDAGQDCGACVFNVKRVMREHRCDPAGHVAPGGSDPRPARRYASSPILTSA